MLENDDLGKMLQYEIPLLQLVINHYESLGYSHTNAELLAIDKYSADLRQAFEQGVSIDAEAQRLSDELEQERIFRGFRGKYPKPL